MCVTMNDCPNVVALRMSGKLLEQVISSERSNEGERDPFIHQEGGWSWSATGRERTATASGSGCNYNTLDYYFSCRK